MPTHSGVTVSLQIDGRKLDEYEVKVDLEADGEDTYPKVECWVASEVGKAFKIHFKVDRKQRKGGVAVSKPKQTDRRAKHFARSSAWPIRILYP
ncbi:hypothetical protein C8T65DRAFT_255026 [Cerioporus squamosus]|nr:hypothetical protein C8T65DRAFT_255026 [Cerioporus squamosus]